METAPLANVSPVFVKSVFEMSTVTDSGAEEFPTGTLGSELLRSEYKHNIGKFK